MNIFEFFSVDQIASVSVVNFKKGNVAKTENRPWYGIAISLGGELSYFHGTKEIKLFGNRMVFLPKYSDYDILCHKTGSFVVVNFLTEKEYGIDEFIHTETQNIDLCRAEFSAMLKSHSANQLQNKYETMSSLYKILSIFADSSEKKIFPSVLCRAIEYIDSNLSDSDLSNTDIADYLCISEVYLRKLFQKNLSTSVNKYIGDKRTDHAKKLLTNTNLSITEISEKCGYSCIYYFCRIFKQKTGCSPGQYRNNNHHTFF